jgi:LuxR family quorum sensing-dependent transcriptional regulator
MSNLGNLVLSVSRDLSAAQTRDDLAEIFCAQIRRLNLTCAASGIVTGPRAASGDPFHFNNWPIEWRNLYARENYLHIDPLAKHALSSGEPATWTDVIASLPRTDPGRKVHAAAIRYGFSEGMVVPLRNGAGEIGMVTMGGDRAKLTADETIFLTAISSTTFFAAEALLAAAQDSAARGAFTPRELDCIGLLGDGLTDAEIASALKISRETVVSHMENARRKVGARSRAHLLSIAMRYGSPVPPKADPPRSALNA